MLRICEILARTGHLALNEKHSCLWAESGLAENRERQGLHAMQTIYATTDSEANQVMNSRAMRWVYRTVPLGSSLIVAAASFALSFVALRDVAARTEAVPQYLAWLVPIVIDGGVMCASAVIWAGVAMGRRRQVFPFLVVFVLVAISVVVNAAHAGPTLLAKVIAALPPLVLLATLELVAISTRATVNSGRSELSGGAGKPERHDLDVEAALATLEADFDSEFEPEFEARLGNLQNGAPRGAGSDRRVVRRSTNSNKRPVRVQATPPDRTEF